MKFKLCPTEGFAREHFKKVTILRLHKSRVFVFNIFNVFRLVVSIIGIMHTALRFWQTLMKPRKLKTVKKTPEGFYIALVDLNELRGGE